MSSEQKQDTWNEQQEVQLSEKEGMFSRGPFLLIGAAGVGGTLIYGLYNMVAGGGDSASLSNKGMRWRVGAQSGLVGALGFVMVYHWFTKFYGGEKEAHH